MYKCRIFTDVYVLDIMYCWADHSLYVLGWFLFLKFSSNPGALCSFVHICDKKISVIFSAVQSYI